MIVHKDRAFVAWVFKELFRNWVFTRIKKLIDPYETRGFYFYRWGIIRRGLGVAALLVLTSVYMHTAKVGV